MPLTVAAAFAVTLVVVLVAFVGYTTYNTVVAMRQRIDKAWANIEVALRQRWDELPNLVNAVRDVMAFEQDVLQRVTELRSAYAPTAPVGQQGTTSAATSAAVRQLFGVVERYPEVRSATNVAELQTEIERLENLIADRRELYNDAVNINNVRIEQFPAVIVARLFNFEDKPLLEFATAEKADVDMKQLFG